MAAEARRQINVCQRNDYQKTPITRVYFLSYVGGVTRIQRGSLAAQRSMLFAWRSSLRVYLEGGAGPRGSTRVHARPTRSEREGLEFRESSVGRAWLWRGSTRVLRRSFADSRGNIYCLRGGETIRSAGPCGPCADPLHISSR